jgi:hypothetical protein
MTAIEEQSLRNCCNGLGDCGERSEGQRPLRLNESELGHSPQNAIPQ